MMKKPNAPVFKKVKNCSRCGLTHWMWFCELQNPIPKTAQEPLTHFGVCQKTTSLTFVFMSVSK